MKQLFFVFSFIMLASMTINAQACQKSASNGKSCCMSKKMASADASTNNDTQVASALMEADAAAAANENITKKTCAMSGISSYYQKSVNNETGTVSWEEVQYDATTKAFTKVASASMEKDENGVKTETKSCAGMKGGKSCCAKKSGAKSCAGMKEGTN